MIDVIIPTYNRATALKKVVDSYLSQDYLGRIIFVDDCSTDTTREYITELAEKYPGKILYHLMGKKTTLTNVRNVGVSLATHEYIFMGEDDVLLPPDHFKILLGKMKEYSADIIGGRRIYMWADQTRETARRFADQDKQPIFVRIPFEAYFERFLDKPMQVLTLHSNTLMKRAVFDKVQYDTAFGAFRDETDFYLRAGAAGFSLWLIPDTLSFHLKNTPVNTTGGARKRWFAHECHVWENTAKLFLRNKKILKEKLDIKNMYIFFIRCMIGRYTYALKRRRDQQRYRKMYEKA